MRTTIRLQDKLLEQAKRKAAEEGRTLTSLVEEGLMIILAEPEQDERQRTVLPVSKASGGILPGVDINNSASLLDVMDGR